MPRSDGSHISVLHETPCDRPGRLQQRMTRLRSVLDFQNVLVDRDKAADNERDPYIGCWVTGGSVRTSSCLYLTEELPTSADGYRVSPKAVQYLELIKVVQYFNLNSNEFFGLEFKGSKCPHKIIWLTHTPFRYLAPVICSHLHIRAFQFILSMYSILFILSQSDKNIDFLSPCRKAKYVNCKLMLTLPKTSTIYCWFNLN